MTAKYFIFFLTVIVFSTGLSAQHQSAKIDDIIQNHIKAMGGLDLLKSVHSIKLTGQYNFRGFEYPFTIFRMRPDFFRLEISKNGKKEINGFDGKIIWEMDESRAMVAREAQDPFNRNFVESNADFNGALMAYQNKESQVTLDGIEEVDGQKAYKIKVTLKSGKIEYWFIDTSSFNLLKRSMKIQYRDREFNHAMYFMDYKRVQGLLIPHYIERLDAHYVRGYEISNVEINQEMDINFFKMPATVSKE